MLLRVGVRPEDHRDLGVRVVLVGHLIRFAPRFRAGRDKEIDGNVLLSQTAPERLVNILSKHAMHGIIHARFAS